MANRSQLLGTNVVLGISLALALVASSGMTAGAMESVGTELGAVESSQDGGSVVLPPDKATLQLLVEAKAELDNMGWEKSESRDAVGGTVSSTYHVPSGQTFGIVLPDGNSDRSNLTNRISIGSDGVGSYIDFSHDDQVALNRGSLAGVVGLLCLAGPVVCIIASAIAASASAYTDTHGICPGNQTARYYYTIDGNISSAKCF